MGSVSLQTLVSQVIQYIESLLCLQQKPDEAMINCKITNVRVRLVLGRIDVLLSLVPSVAISCCGHIFEEYLYCTVY